MTRLGAAFSLAAELVCGRRMEVEMIARRLSFVIVALLLAIPLSTQADAEWRSINPIEPTAGNWQTWVIDSGASYRVDRAADDSRDTRRAARAEGVDPAERRGGPATDQILGRRVSRVSLDRPDQRAIRGRHARDPVPTSCMDLRCAGGLRRDGRDLGFEVLLQAVPAESARLLRADGVACAQ